MKNSYIKVRLEPHEREQIKILAKQNNFLSVSEYIRFVALNAEIVVKAKNGN